MSMSCDTESLKYKIARSPGSPTAYIKLAELASSSDVEFVTLPDGRVLAPVELCAAAVANDPFFFPAYLALAKLMKLTDVKEVGVADERWTLRTVAAKGLALEPGCAELRSLCES